MPGGDIPDDARRFVAEQVHSVEFIEVLLFLRDRKSAWTADGISRELRSNAASVARRLERLKDLGFLAERGGEPPAYAFDPRTPALAAIGDGLAQSYQVCRHKLFELIFQPLRGPKNFADAFRVKKDEDDRG